MDRKVFSTKVSTSPDKGIAEMIVSVFNNVDRGNDIIRPGAFKDSLGIRLPKGVWSHKWEQPIAKTLEAKELEPGHRQLPSELKDLGGLFIRAAFNLETQRGKEAFSDIKFGIIDEFSIGFKTVKSAWDEENEVRELLQVDLFEWSPVLAGMNPATRLISVKSDDEEPLTGLTIAQHSDQVLVTLEGKAERILGIADQMLAISQPYFERFEEIADLRAKEGRVLSERNRNRMRNCCAALTETMGAMKRVYDDMWSLINATEPKPKKPKKEVDELDIEPRPEPKPQPEIKQETKPEQSSEEKTEEKQEPSLGQITELKPEHIPVKRTKEQIEQFIYIQNQSKLQHAQFQRTINDLRKT